MLRPRNVPQRFLMGDVVISRNRTNKIKLLTDLENKELLDDLESNGSQKNASESVVFTDDDDELTISIAGLVKDGKGNFG